MIYVAIAAMLIEAALFIAKEHADRKKTVAALMLIPADRVDVLRYKVLTKSWWEQIQENLKTIGLILIGALLAWAVIMMTRG